MSNLSLLPMLLGVVALPCMVSWCGCWMMRRYAPHWGLVDQPAARKIHAAPMPLGGGLAVLCGVLLPLALGSLLLWLVHAQYWSAEWLPAIVREHQAGLWNQMPKLWLLLGFAAALSLLGLCDDVRPLPWPWRLGGELFLAMAVVTLMEEMRLTLFLPMPWLTYCISVLWITGMINAFNMLDNMDGLSSGVAAIASGGMSILMLTMPDPLTQQPQLFVAGLALVILGSLLGFLAHNFPPARIFLGDAGSYAVGFLLSACTLLATYATSGNHREHAVLTPLCLLAVPLYDMLSVILIRLYHGKSPFQGDKNHFSHRLVRLGLSHTRAVLAIYGITAACCLAGIVMPHVTWWGALGLFALVVCLLSVVGGLERTYLLKNRR